MARNEPEWPLSQGPHGIGRLRLQVSGMATGDCYRSDPDGPNRDGGFRSLRGYGEVQHPVQMGRDDQEKVEI